MQRRLAPYDAALGSAGPERAPARGRRRRDLAAGDLGRWSVRIAYLALLAAVPFLPIAESSFFIYPRSEHLWVLGVLCAVFALPFVDLSRRALAANLDLLALVSPIAVLALFEPWRPAVLLLLYPPLAYLAVRMWRVARLGRRDAVRSAEAGPEEAQARRAPRALSARALSSSWLVLGMVVLVVAHVNWTLDTGTSSDVGYAGVHGALQVLDGKALYGATPGIDAKLGYDPHYDTYGPANYEAYIPFVWLTGSRSAARHLGPFGAYEPFARPAAARTAAQLATLLFDLLTALLLFLLGRRARGAQAGIALAYAWLALPLLFYNDAFGFDDVLVSATLAATLLVAGSPLRRGVAAALAVWTKLVPLALLPLLAGHGAAPGSRRRTLVVFAAAFLLASLVVFAPALAHSTASSFVRRTFDYQASRAPSLSIWSLAQEGALGAASAVRRSFEVLHGVLAALTGVLAIWLLWAPRRQDVIGLAAASAAVLIALTICLGHFSFSYAVWFAPVVLVAALLPRFENGSTGRAST